MAVQVQESDVAPFGVAAPDGRPVVPGGESAVHTARPAESRIVRAMWGGVGTFSLAFGLIGVVVPGWPTTIFLIIAAACYARSSQRMYDRILANPVFGPHVRRFRETGGMPLKAKVFALAIMWPFFLFAVFVAIPTATLWPHAIVLLLAVIGTAYILSRPTDRADALASFPTEA